FKKDDFLSKSKNFLNNNPDCIYECQLRKMRVETLSSLSQREEAKEIEIKKLKEGLKARYKHPEVYPEILQNIRDFYGDLGKDEKAKIYEKAAEEYEDRFDSGDLDLTYRGVNDFLRKKGELKGQ
ncbi:MAG: hypothetical protein SVV03_04955, partial [Candidatus Nanohaloarchaea archaeon]|nr:hypothetical protein [Candidatus Nanohaloarchaea archaeon]